MHQDFLLGQTEDIRVHLYLAIVDCGIDCDQEHITRVAKCHGYGGYIRVRKLEGWGKKSGRINSFAKSSIVLGKFDQLI